MENSTNEVGKNEITHVQIHLQQKVQETTWGKFHPCAPRFLGVAPFTNVNKTGQPWQLSLRMDESHCLSSPWLGFNSQSWWSTLREFTWITHTLPTCPKPAWQKTSTFPRLYHCSCRGGRPKSNHGQRIASFSYPHGSSAARSRAEIGLLSLRLSVSQGASLGVVLLAPACPIENVRWGAQFIYSRAPKPTRVSQKTIFLPELRIDLGSLDPEPSMLSTRLWLQTMAKN